MKAKYHRPGLILGAILSAALCFYGCDEDTSYTPESEPGTGQPQDSGNGSESGNSAGNENQNTGDENQGTGDENQNTGDENQNTGDENQGTGVEDEDDPPIPPDDDELEKPEDQTPEPDPPTTEEEVFTVIKALESIVETTEPKPLSLKGKTVIFIGNSQIYYGEVVKKLTKDKTGKKDTGGQFIRLAKKVESNVDVNVYNCTYPNASISGSLDICKKRVKIDSKKVDYVIVSNGAVSSHSKSLKTALNKVKNTYSKAKYIYLLQEYAYHPGASGKGKSYAEADRKDAKEAKYSVADWGGVVHAFIQKKDYTLWDFRVYQSDGTRRHPNYLSGYITAASAYSIMTNTPATKLPHNLYSKQSDFEDKLKSYAKKYKSGVKTNFASIMKSSQKMSDIKKKIEELTKIKPTTTTKTCEHEFGEPHDISLAASHNTDGVAKATCSKCGHDMRVLFTSSILHDTNVMQISSETLKASGKASVEEYMQAGLGNVFRQTGDRTWGRQGYSSISGSKMASLCDGNRAKSETNDMIWKIDPKRSTYDAAGNASTNDKYITLIGYSYQTPVTVSRFALFTGSKDLSGFDILGGTKQDDGTYTWSVLWNGPELSYNAYDDNTQFITGSFENPAKIDAIQIGVISTANNAEAIHITEFEVYGE
ncbi:MAG: hypothetical protein IJM59_08055 [Proteobacteria bacterium]|nr:hypothetical protein [Pseudomonadota bacterium]